MGRPKGSKNKKHKVTKPVIKKTIKERGGARVGAGRPEKITCSFNEVCTPYLTKKLVETLTRGNLLAQNSEEPKTFVCPTCGHICEKGTGKTVNDDGRQVEYCKTCAPKYDERDSWVWYSEYKKMADCNEDGSLIDNRNLLQRIFNSKLY